MDKISLKCNNDAGHRSAVGGYFQRIKRTDKNYVPENNSENNTMAATME